MKKINNYIYESIHHMLDLDYQNFEILIFPEYGIESANDETEDYAAKSRESLKSARILFQAECYNSCISRCYYAMFQMGIAALDKRGIKPPVEGKYGHSWGSRSGS